MLDDGTIIDSVILPQGSVREHPVTVSAESLMQSVQALNDSAQGHPITFSGGSIMDSIHGQDAAQRERFSAEGHPIMFSGGSIMDSLDQRDSMASGNNVYETAQDYQSDHQRDLVGSRNTQSAETAFSSQTLLGSNVGRNESAGMQNLQRHIDSLDGEAVRYRPVTVSSAQELGNRDTVPGNLSTFQ